MFKGVLTLDAYEQCLKRGLCESHNKEVNQNELAVQLDELPRKTFLFIRVNILYTLLFKKSSKCERIKILLQRTPIFSRILAKGDASEAADAILILDSVVIFTLCQLSKICCIGALFQKNDETSEDPEIKLLQKLLLVDRFEGNILYHLYPLLQKNFAGFDMDLIKVSYVLTLLFVRNYCIKLNIKIAIETIEKDLKGGSQWENFKNMGDISYQKGYYKDASNAYTSAVMLNSYSSMLFTQRAQTYLKLGKLKAAQLDAYIAVIIDPKCCEGYYAFSSSLFHQKLYQDAFDVAKYGLAVCESNGSFYETLQTLHIEIEMKYSNKESSNNMPENSINHNNSAEKPLPEKKYFPVLVDSDSADSDSEARRKNVPELVEASDSDDDESETVEKKIVCPQTKNKTKKKRIPSEDSSDVISTQMDIVKIHTWLKEASEAILSDCGYKAIQIYRGSLRDFIDSSKLSTFDECEVVCIKYAYGIAYCKSGGYDDLLKCITILKEIIEKHDSVTFPAAYYALGLTYRKLNRFKDALNYLETVQSFLSKGIHFKVYPWPGILTVIPETKSDILKVLVKDLIKECENPPNPDALCRFADCSYQPTIYYSDPDFKGYISLLCSEQCCLQYHLQCWKTIKAEKKLTDKEFLDEACFTPDCDGVIIKVQTIDRKGDLAKEFIADIKKTVKQKWAKWEKKTDVKDRKKKRSNSRSEDGTHEVPSENGKVSSRKNSDANDKFIPIQDSGNVIPPILKDTISTDSMLRSPEKVKPPELDVNSKKSDICSLSANSAQEIKYVTHDSIKSEVNVQEAPYCLHDSEKGKELSNVLSPYCPHDSKKENEVSGVQEALYCLHDSEKGKELSNVLEAPYCPHDSKKENEVSGVQEAPYCLHDSKKGKEVSSVQEASHSPHDSEKGKELSNDLETPDVSHAFDKDRDYCAAPKTTIISDFENESKYNTKGVQEHTSQYLVSQCIKNNVYSYMSDFLQHHGPLRTDDPLLTDELSSFPDEVNTMISECGSIGEFLKNDLRFAFVGDAYVCVVSDLAKAYRMNSSSSLPTDLESFQSLESTDNTKYLNGCNADSQPQNFGLNPDAVEYTPVVPSVSSKNNDHRIYENSFSNDSNASNSSFGPKSLNAPSNSTNVINKSQKNKSKSCDTVLDIKLQDNSESVFVTAHSEHTKIFVNKESNGESSSEHMYNSKLSPKAANSDSNINTINQNFQESNGNICASARDLYPSDLNKGIEGICSSAENSKIKKLQTQLLPALKEFIDESFNSYHHYIDACIKPYTIRKLPEIVTTETETDFENTSTEESRCFTNTLEAENKQLEEQNLSLKNQLASATEEIKELYDEASKLKTSLSSSSFDVEVLKLDFRKKEETLLNGREYLIKSLTDAHTSIDEQKKRIDLLESVNSGLEETVSNLTASLNDAEEKMENAVKAEEKKYNDIIKCLQQENDELKSRLKYAEIQFLQTKKTEFLKRIEDKCHDVSMKKQEFTQGLSMMSGNLNPMVHSSMKTIFSQFSCYENELKALKLEFVKKIEEQIEKVEKGTPLKELKEIEIKRIPDLPHLQNPFPEFDKSLLNSTEMAFSLLHVGSLPQMPSASVIPQATTSAACIPPTPATIIPPANSSATVIKPSTLPAVIPQAKPAAAIIPQAIPSALKIPQAIPSALKIPQATPSATIIPQVTPCSKIIQPPTPSAAVISPVTQSVLSSIMPSVEANQKKTFDILNCDVKEPLKNPGISINTFNSIPYSVPTLDKEFNKTCAIFRPTDPGPNKKLDTPKVPPGMNCATTLVTSRTASSSSKDSLETFPIGEMAFGSMNSASRANEPVVSSSEQEVMNLKKKTTGHKIGNSYDKLLTKLKEQFPSYNQEELISIVKEFRSQRKGKLTGLPIDAIISELKAVINAKRESERKIYEQKVQPKVLVNKKLVPDPRVPDVTEQQSVKKKSAWGSVDSDSKRMFSGSSDDDCTICCDPMTTTSAYKVACGHTFHEQCIRLWLKNKSNCPVCRVLLLLPEEYPSLS